MAITVGTGEPASFTAGDSVSWTRYEADYLPAAGWTIVYGFFGPARFNVTTTTSGTSHLATLPTSTATVLPGVYSWTARATHASLGTIDIGSGQMVALPNLAVTNAELDTLEVQLALAKTAYYDLAKGKFSSISVDGISYTKQNADALWRHILRLERRIEAEKARLRSLLGFSTGSQIRTHFRN